MRPKHKGCEEHGTHNQALDYTPSVEAFHGQDEGHIWVLNGMSVFKED